MYSRLTLRLTKRRPSLNIVKRSETEADHSPPSSAEVKNAWSYTSTLSFVFMAWRLIKHRDSLNSYLIFSMHIFTYNKHELTLN
jgi:hypothetical protein